MGNSSRLEKAEARGFPREEFPISYKGHFLHLPLNDAHDTADDRVLLHVTLECSNCGEAQVVRGRFPAGEGSSRQVAMAKLASFGPFTEPCDG